MKWINGQNSEHYTDSEYITKLGELNILPMESKFALNDLVLFYKIINNLVPIKLPEHFTFIKPDEVRYTRKTSVIIEDKDFTYIKCSIKPYCDSFRNSYFYRTMKLWNGLPYYTRQLLGLSKFKSQVTKFLWSSDLAWPD